MISPSGIPSWLKELQWARAQIDAAKTPEEKNAAIAYHKTICEIGVKL